MIVFVFASEELFFRQAANGGSSERRLKEVLLINGAVAQVVRALDS